MVTYPDAVRLADHNGQLPFYYLLQGNCLRQGNLLVPLMDLFIEAHPSCINVVNDSGMTPLFIAMAHVANTDFSVMLHLSITWTSDISCPCTLL
jgi:ankyrin repeat protein